MIGPEDIQETPKTNYTPILVLGIAALLLLIVGFISYRDYVNAEAEKKVKSSDERIRKLEEQLEKYTAGGQPAAANQSNALAARDPEIEELRRQLDAMKLQSDTIKKQTERTKQLVEENSMKVERVLSGGPGGGSDSFPPDMASIPPPGINDEISDPLRDAVVAPPGGYRSAATQASLTEVQRKVREAPAIGKIVSYDEGWNLITIGAGKSNGIDVGQRYSVRRGSDVLGVVKIFEVFTNQSNANIVTDNRKFDGALKPQVGDDIISFDPF